MESPSTSDPTTTTTSPAEPDATPVETSPAASATSIASSLLSDDLPIATSTISSGSAATPSPTLPVLPDGGLEMRPGNAVVNFILGLLLITGSSIMNSFGLNLMKYDHIQAKASSDKRPEYLRPKWLAGITSYVLSQLIGSTLALQYLRSEFVAPLGASSLIFNFLFASYFLSTPISRRDIQGTLLIVLGVLAILIFASINSGLSTSLSLARLETLSGRGAYVVYLLGQIIVLVLAWLSLISLSLLSESRSSILSTTSFPPTAPPPPPSWLPKSLFGSILPRTHKLYHIHFLIPLQTHIHHLTEKTSDDRLLFLLGVGWASVGGALAGGSLVFAKSMVMVGMDGVGYAHWVTAWTGLLLGACAVSQMIALNRGLKYYDSTLVVPVFYAGYTLLGFLNTMIFLDQFPAYSYTILFFLLLSIALLLSGVVLLSTKKEEGPSSQPPGPDGSSRPSDGGDDDQRRMLDAEEGGAGGSWANGRGDASGGDGEAAERRRKERDRLQAEGGEEGQALFGKNGRDREEGDGEDDGPRAGEQFELGGMSDSEDEEGQEKKMAKGKEERTKVIGTESDEEDDEVSGAWNDAPISSSPLPAADDGGRSERK